MLDFNTARQGRLIMFDGPDGVGKTEQITRAAAALTQGGARVHTSRVHGGTPFGELLRDVSLSNTPRRPRTDLLLSQAMHSELADDLRAIRAEGVTCLVDRSPASMWAYQVHGSGLDPEIARPIVDSDFTYFNPDFLIIYSAGLDVLKSRITQRSGAKSDYFEAKPNDFHHRVIAGYIEAAEMYNGIIIDASNDIETVHRRTMSVIA